MVLYCQFHSDNCYIVQLSIDVKLCLAGYTLVTVYEKLCIIEHSDTDVVTYECFDLCPQQTIIQMCSICDSIRKLHTSKLRTGCCHTLPTSQSQPSLVAACAIRCEMKKKQSCERKSPHRKMFTNCSS